MTLFLKYRCFQNSQLSKSCLLKRLLTSVQPSFPSGGSHSHFWDPSPHWKHSYSKQNRKYTGPLALQVSYRHSRSIAAGMRSPSSHRLLLSRLHQARELICVLLISKLFLCFLQKGRLAMSLFICLLFSGFCSSEASLITSHLAFSQDSQLWWPRGLQNFTLLEVEQSAPIPGGFNFMFTSCDSSSSCPQICGISL